MILKIFITVFVVLAIILGTFRYIKGFWPGSRVIIEEPPETSDKVSDTNAKFMFFHAEWCPYSKKPKQEWDSFKQMMKNSPKKYGGKTITFEDIDGDMEPGRLAVYKVKDYPTFKLQTKDKMYKMLGNFTPANFRAFLKASLGNESS